MAGRPHCRRGRHHRRRARVRATTSSPPTTPAVQLTSLAGREAARQPGRKLDSQGALHRVSWPVKYPASQATNLTARQPSQASWQAASQPARQGASSPARPAATGLRGEPISRLEHLIFSPSMAFSTLSKLIAAAARKRRPGRWAFKMSPHFKFLSYPPLPEHNITLAAEILLSQTMNLLTKILASCKSFFRMKCVSPIIFFFCLLVTFVLFVYFVLFMARVFAGVGSLLRMNFLVKFGAAGRAHSRTFFFVNKDSKNSKLSVFCTLNLMHVRVVHVLLTCN